MHHHERHALVTARLQLAVHHCPLPSRLLCKLSCHSFWPAGPTRVSTTLTHSSISQSWVSRASHVSDRLRMEGLRFRLSEKYVLPNDQKLWSTPYLWNFPITWEPGETYAEGQIWEESVNVGSSGPSSTLLMRTKIVSRGLLWKIEVVNLLLTYTSMYATMAMHTGWHDTHFCRLQMHVEYKPNLVNKMKTPQIMFNCIKLK